MSTDSNDDSDELTVESLTKSKSEIFSEHGLENTTLGKAVEKQEREQERDATKRQRLVEKKILLAQAEQRGLGDDPDVEALRADIHDMSGELEADALRAQHQDDLEEARAKIDNLEGLATRADSQNQDRLAHNYRQRAASLKAEFPELEDDDEPNKYSAEALGLADDDEAEKEKEAAEALQEFKDKKERKVKDEELPEDVKARLAQYKQMRAQASTDSLRDMYQGKIEALREEYAE